MEIKYQGHTKRVERAREFWNTVVVQYNNGMSANEIAKSHINPSTGKHYKKASIYLILKKMGQL